MKLSKKYFLIALSLLFSAATYAEGNHLESPYITITDEIISPEMVNGSIVPMAGGAWTSTGVAPTITNKGTLYQLNLPVVGNVPSNSTITKVNYKWSLSNIPSGLEVYLCHDNLSACWSVKNNQTGSTTVFNGLNANKKLILAFQVSGYGQLSPTAFGQSSQVTVIYN